MKRKPIDYSALTAVPAAVSPQSTASLPPLPEQPQVTPAKHPGRPRTAKKLRDEASTVLLYLHPQAHEALKIMAAQKGRGVRVHDLLIDAIEHYLRAAAIRVPVRVQTTRSVAHAEEEGRAQLDIENAIRDR